MARPSLPHPWPCNYWPDFPTQNEARELIVRYQEAGHIKHCDHADVDYVGGYGEAKKYRPVCRKESMIAIPSGTRVGAYGNNYLFYGCPEGCHYYSSARRASAARRVGSTWRTVTAPIAGAPKWFASLSAGAQTMIVASILVVVLGTFAPRFLAALADFLRALK